MNLTIITKFYLLIANFNSLFAYQMQIKHKNSKNIYKNICTNEKYECSYKNIFCELFLITKNIHWKNTCFNSTSCYKFYCLLVLFDNSFQPELFLIEPARFLLCDNLKLLFVINSFYALFAKFTQPSKTICKYLILIQTIFLIFHDIFLFVLFYLSCSSG